MKKNDEKISASPENVKDSKHNGSKRKRKKYSAEYISYVEHGDSAIVFITRDIVRSINTNGKWVDVVDSSGDQRIFTDEGDSKYRWDFDWFIVELFPRVTKPDYSNVHDVIRQEKINHIYDILTKHKSVHSSLNGSLMKCLLRVDFFKEVVYNKLWEKSLTCSTKSEFRKEQ